MKASVFGIIVATAMLTACGESSAPANPEAREDTESVSSAITVSAVPVINAVTNSTYTTTIRRGDALIIWGSGFTANSNTVTITQYNNTWNHPANNGTWWWNGNDNQINTILPSNAAPNDYIDVQVNGPSGSSGAYRVWITQ